MVLRITDAWNISAGVVEDREPGSAETNLLVLLPDGGLYKDGSQGTQPHPYPIAGKGTDGIMGNRGW